MESQITATEKWVLVVFGKQVVFEHLVRLPMGKVIEAAFLALESAKGLSADL